MLSRHSPMQNGAFRHLKEPAPHMRSCPARQTAAGESARTPRRTRHMRRWRRTGSGTSTRPWPVSRAPHHAAGCARDRRSLPLSHARVAGVIRPECGLLADGSQAPGRAVRTSFFNDGIANPIIQQRVPVRVRCRPAALHHQLLVGARRHGRPALPELPTERPGLELQQHLLPWQQQ